MKWIRTLILLFLVIHTIGIAYAAESRQPQEYDLVKLKSGTVLEGCIVDESPQWISIESLAGKFTIRLNTVAHVAHASPGESELMLGLELLSQQRFKRAITFLRKSTTYRTWRNSSEEALLELGRIQEGMKEETRKTEKTEIERLIQSKGLQAGIKELERRHKKEDEFWGSYRGRLHLLMARERIDRLDFYKAEWHLKLASNYNADPTQWEKVRGELLAMRKRSANVGIETLMAERKADLERRRLQNRSPLSSQFLVLVDKSKRKGEKIPPIDWLRHVDRYAKKNNLDPLLIWAVIDTESSWRRKAVSKVGAQGLMQLMPPTAKDLDVSDPFDAEQNIRGGSQYLRFLIEMFDNVDTALAAYNVGPGRVERNGVPKVGKVYIEKVRTRHAKLQQRFSKLAAT